MPKKDGLILVGIKHYLQSQCYIKGLSVNDKRHIRKRSKDFTFVNGELYFKQRIVCDGVEALAEGTTEYDHLRKVLIRDADKLRAVTEHHIAENGSHIGFEKTCRGVKMAYYWLGIPAYVRHSMRTCSVCMTRRNDTETLKVELDKQETQHGQIEDNSEDDCERVGNELDTSFEKDVTAEELESNSHFWNTVELKVFGPYEIQSGKSIYVCIVIDTYSKWCEIQLLDNITVISISKFIFHLTCRYGVMKCVNMEDDRVNTTDMIKLLNNALSTSIGISTTSCLDYLWDKMKEDLECFVQNDAEDWYKCLDIFLVPFRLFSIHNNLSAAFLAHGREPEIPSVITHNTESSPINIENLVKIYKTFGGDQVGHTHCQDIQPDITVPILEDVHSQTLKTQTEEPEDVEMAIACINVDATDNGPEDATDNGDEDATDNGPEDATDNGDEDATDNGPEDVTENGAEDATDNGPEDVTDNGPEDATDNGPEDVTEKGAENASDNGDHSIEQAPAMKLDTEMNEKTEDLPESKFGENIEIQNKESVVDEPKEVTMSRVTRNSRKRGRRDLNSSPDNSDLGLTESNNSTEELKTCNNDGEKGHANDEESPSPRRSRRSQVFNKKFNIRKNNKLAKIQNVAEKREVKKESKVSLKTKDSVCDNDVSDEDGADETHENEPEVDSDIDNDYVPEVESHSSLASNTRRSLRGIKQDWSCLLKKRKLPMKLTTAKKARTKKVQISMKKRRSSKSESSPQKVKRSISKEDQDQDKYDVSISSLETEEYYNGVKYYLEKQQSSKIKKAITNFRLENDHLYYQATPKHIEKEIIISEKERVRLMARAHVDDEGTHLCKRKVIDCISAMEYYWRGLTLDCEAFVRACPQCNNGDIRKMESVEIKEKDFEKSKEDEINSDIIKEYLDNKLYPKHYDKKKKTTLRRKAANYTKKDGLLYYQHKSSHKPRLCLFTSEEKRKAIKNAHIIKDSGQHLGLNKTQDIVKNNYYWIGQTNDVYRYISQCCLVTEKLDTEFKTTKQAIEDRIDKFSTYFYDGSLDNFIKKKKIVVEDKISIIVSPPNIEVEKITDTSHPPSKSSKQVGEPVQTESKCTEAEPLTVQSVIDEPKQTINLGSLVPIRPVPIKIEPEEVSRVIIPATYDASTNTLAFIPPICSTTARDCKKRNSIDVKPDVTSTKSSWHECNICKAVFSGKVAYKFHMMKHSGQKPFLCNYCKKGFTSIKAKQLHHRKHTGDQPYLCNICARGFERKEGLKYHLKAHERGGGVPVICDICNRSFQTVSRLKVHKACKHPVIKPTFSCNECQKTFSSKSSFKRHYASTHLQEKNYVCNYCTRAFARKEYLDKHVLNQHSKTADTVTDTQIKIEGNHSTPYYIDAATLAQLTETGEVTIQSDIVLNEADINDSNTVVFTGDSVQYEVECLTSDQAIVADDQAIQLLVQASLQSQQLQIQHQQLELEAPESLPHDQHFHISHVVSQPE